MGKIDKLKYESQMDALVDINRQLCTDFLDLIKYKAPAEQQMASLIKITEMIRSLTDHMRFSITTVKNYQYLAKRQDSDKSLKPYDYEYTPEELMIIIENFENKLDNAYQIERHWDNLQKYINSNETIKKEWDKFCALMKLYGGNE